MVDQAFRKGRLVIYGLGAEQFAWKIVRKASKWAVAEEILEAGITRG